MLLGKGHFHEETWNNISYQLVSLGLEGIARIQSMDSFFISEKKEEEPVLQFKESNWWRCSVSSAMPRAFLQSRFVCKELAICCVWGAGEVHMSECRRRNVDSQLLGAEFQNFLCLWGFLEPRSKGTNIAWGLFFRFEI